MENNNNNDFDNIPNKFQNENDPGPFAPPPQQQATYNSYNNQPAEPEMTVGKWMLTFLVLMIPCVGLIMYIVWAFSDENKTRRDYCRAYLLFMIIVSVVVMIFWFAMFAAIIGAAGGMGVW